MFSMIRTVVFVAFFMGALITPFAQANSCSAYAPECGATCYIEAPAGGTVHCQSSGDIAACIAYDSQGNIYDSEIDRCPIQIPGIGC